MIKKLKNIIKDQIEVFFLNEGLIKSYTTHELDRLLFRKFENNFKYNYKLNIRKDENGIELDVGNFDKKGFVEFENLINNAGYFISLIFTVDINGKEKDSKYNREYFLNILENKKKFKTIELTVEKKFDSKYPTIRFLYHVTPSINLPKIMKNGLSPKTKSKKSYHPERVYFTKKIEDAINIIPKFKEFERGEYSVLKIDTKKIGHRIALYNDPNFNNGYYTYDVISPNSITIQNKVY
jgi:hypothetical protein